MLPRPPFEAVCARWLVYRNFDWMISWPSAFYEEYRLCDLLPPQDTSKPDVVCVAAMWDAVDALNWGSTRLSPSLSRKYLQLSKQRRICLECIKLCIGRRGNPNLLWSLLYQMRTKSKKPLLENTESQILNISHHDRLKHIKHSDTQAWKS